MFFRKWETVKSSLFLFFSFFLIFHFYCYRRTVQRSGISKTAEPRAKKIYRQNVNREKEKGRRRRRKKKRKGRKGREREIGEGGKRREEGEEAKVTGINGEGREKVVFIPTGKERKKKAGENT